MYALVKKIIRKIEDLAILIYYTRSKVQNLS